MASLTYTEAAKRSRDVLHTGVIETIINTSNILDRIPMITVNGKSFTYNVEATLPGVAWRSITGTYTASTGTVNNTTELLKVLGGIVEVDRVLQDGMSDHMDQLAYEMKGMAKALSLDFNKNFINGDDSADANQWDGLKVKLTGAQVISAATNGLAIVGADDAARFAFFAKLDELIDQVDGRPHVLYMNRGVLAKIKQSAFQLKMNLESGLDNFGKKVAFYDGIPLMDIGVDAAGDDIIPQTETQGTSSVASSIYAVRFSDSQTEVGVMGLEGAGGLIVEQLPRIDTKYKGLVELYSGIAVFGGKAAARLTGVLAS